MRKLIADEWMTLDGVVQAPGYDGEDSDGGFRHGGWHMPHMDDMTTNWVTRTTVETGAFLFGRRTYEIFASFWPTAPDELATLAEVLNNRPKYVVSTTLTEPLAWHNSTVLDGDVAKAVESLKQEDGGDLHVVGSSRLTQTLIENDLVDELRLFIEPVLVGGGKRIFPDDGAQRRLRLSGSQVTTTGVIIATYTRAES
ncbi:deaminase [Micromonospora acroterricola]|uniref:Deaminase n=1 Tax=Micromonospora acroterricola TaxID=2202421 RepID=A0A317D7A6_9ACTN|nr:dihydrofolate reductase family protein [Micromonospora acroterricola]PWR10761.1 deaminase [Micromonospora acroterricola]